MSSTPTVPTLKAPRDRADGGIELDHVTHRFVSPGGESVHAVDDADLVIGPGEFVCVVGPSGCGKSTLLNIIAGFLRPTAGAVRVDGVEVTAPSHERGVVFQQPNLFPWLSVRRNVELGLKFRGISTSVRRERAHAFLEIVGLSRFADSKPYELSGGMQQRAQIARVLANDPSIMLMDEPFGALDALTRERLQGDLLSISRENQTTVFFITHSVDEAVFLGDRVLVMSPRPGRIVLDQPIRISAEYGHLLGDELRSTPQFARLRDTIASAIQQDG